MHTVFRCRLRRRYIVRLRSVSCGRSVRADFPGSQGSAPMQNFSWPIVGRRLQCAATSPDGARRPADRPRHTSKSVPENIALGACASMPSTVLPTNQRRRPQIRRALVARLDRSADRRGVGDRCPAVSAFDARDQRSSAIEHQRQRGQTPKMTTGLHLTRGPITKGDRRSCRHLLASR
jgi:hypothetical protein